MWLSQQAAVEIVFIYESANYFEATFVQITLSSHRTVTTLLARLWTQNMTGSDAPNRDKNLGHYQIQWSLLTRSNWKYNTRIWNFSLHVGYEL